MCSRKSWATPVESKEVTVGMVWICLDRQSTTTRMALYPFESRSSPIMSMEITCQCRSGTLLGDQLPHLLCREGLCPVACVTSHDELVNIPAHPWPPLLPCHHSPHLP